MPFDFWARDKIEYLANLGIMEGYPNGYFYPYKSVSRAELNSILKIKASSDAFTYEKINRLQAVRSIVRFAKIKVPKNIPRAPYLDVPKGAIGANEIWAAKNAGILEYIPGPYFEPEKKINRAEVAELIAKTKFARGKIQDFIKN